MTAQLLDHTGLRRTPAGIAMLRVRVAHQGEQAEAGRLRQVRLETELVAFGPVAETLAAQAPGSELRFTGFLDRRGTQGNQLELHVTEFGLLKGLQASATRLPSPGGATNPGAVLRFIEE
ncbi:MAG TPA: primosomal replication protein N [Thiobacillaceae bacterium]|nr:primosomal replication protein N [Thiobacillaceae bacterium]